MKFMARRRQKPPTIIIISLIDILIVLLIFMMVTTTFKQKTILNLSLPQSRSESSTQVENQSVVVSIAPKAPSLTHRKTTEPRRRSRSRTCCCEAMKSRSVLRSSE